MCRLINTGSLAFPFRFTKYLLRPTWVEIDLDAIDYNVRNLKRKLGHRKLIGVLKGDACGFGVTECGQAMEAAGIDMLAVGNPNDAKKLREGGVKRPILLFLSYLSESLPEIISLNVIPTVVNIETILYLIDMAKNYRYTNVKIFIKVDTGLGRIGVSLKMVKSLVKVISNTSYLKLAGLYSHLGNSSDDRADELYNRFKDLLFDLSEAGFNVPIAAIASSSWFVKHQYMWLNAVDPGRLVFGIVPDDRLDIPLGFIRPALRALRTRIIQIKDVTEYDPISYRNQNVKKYGIIPFGWVDISLPRIFEQGGALLKGIEVSFLKPLSAEHGVLDLTNVPDAMVGDVVTIIGKDGSSVKDFHGENIILSDLTRRFHRHMARVYYRNGKPIMINDTYNKILL